MSNLPIIDISPWVNKSTTTEELNNVATQWNEAIRDLGYAVIVGHGIEESMFDAVNSEAQAFFCRNDKMAYSRGGYGHPLGGYTPAGKENVEMSFDEKSSASSGDKKRPDPVENFVFTSHPVGFIAPDGTQGSPIAPADNYYSAMTQLLSTIHSISATALGLPELNYIDKFYDKSVPGNENLGSDGNCLRLANYFPQNASIPKSTSKSTNMVAETEIRYGAHTDFQGFTILRPDKSDWHEKVITSEGVEVNIVCGGLEVFNRNTNEWIPVKIPTHLNALVINAGDLIQRWTNDYWLSPIHRVVTTPHIASISSVKDNSNDNSNDENITIQLPSRQAIVFFTGPLEDCIIEVLPLPHILNHRGGEVYGPIKSGDWLHMKINKINT